MTRTFDEAVHTVDTVRIPRLGLLYRTEEHLVHTQCIRTVFLNNHIGINDVEHGFTHLLHSPAADVFTIFQINSALANSGRHALKASGDPEYH